MNNENKTRNNLLMYIIIILIIILMGIGGILVYNDKDNECDVNNNIIENEVVEENKDNKNEVVYKNYVENFKLNRNQTINRIDDVSINDKLGISSLRISNNGDAFLYLDNSDLISKYGRNYKVMSNVLTADVLEFGNGGFRSIIFIKEDGSLTAIDSSLLINNKEIKLIDYFGNIKNIIDIIQTSDSEQMTITAIDIYGNAYNLIDYLK